MLPRLSLVLLIALTAAACAPSADLRIPNLDAPIRPGRLVVVPVQTDGAPVEVWDELYAATEFEDAGEHDAAFWAALTASLQAELGWGMVRLLPAVSDTGFVEVRALMQGARGLRSESWSVRTVSVPSRVDYAALEADHVLLVRDVTIDDDLRSSGGSVNGIDVGLKRVLVADADILWMDAQQEAPLLALRVSGAGDQRGRLFRKELNRDSWSAAIDELAERIRRVTSVPR